MVIAPYWIRDTVKALVAGGIVEGRGLTMRLLCRGNKKVGGALVFNLPVFKTCPGSTLFCRAYCYGDWATTAGRWPEESVRPTAGGVRPAAFPPSRPRQSPVYRASHRGGRLRYDPGAD
jgi:hypothetical protein